MSKIFEARFGGICAHCSHPFVPGDEIGYGTDDELRCEACLSGREPAAKRPTPRCDECGLNHAGECW